MLLDQIKLGLAQLATSPKVESDLEADGLEELLEVPTAQLLDRIAKMASNYLQVQAQQKPEAADPKLETREGGVAIVWLATGCGPTVEEAPSDRGPAAGWPSWRCRSSASASSTTPPSSTASSAACWRRWRA